MVKEVEILSSNHTKLAASQVVEQLLKTSKEDFLFTHIDDELVVILKEAEEAATTEKVRALAGTIAKDLRSKQVEKVTVDANTLSETWSSLDLGALVQAFTEGWHLASYTFVKYKSKQENKEVTLTIHGDQAVENSVKIGEKRAAATNFSRDLMNELSSELTPASFPNVLREAFANENVELIVHDQSAIEKLEMNGVLTVARGSIYEPSFVEIRYVGDASKPLTALVGKGVTFDTGGISLKQARDLSDMRMDMGGAAAVAGAMKLLASTNAAVNAVALIPIVENMPDRKSLIPGEVITYKNGSTVQVGNTDAEGRLILADGIIRAQELKADYIVDIATLTGAVISALGTKVAGTFGSDELAKLMQSVGENNGEATWQLPLIDAYDDYLKSDYADFSNISSKGEAGSITAALFLRRFVTDANKWLHVDMAGVMESGNQGYEVKGGSGFGARLLADFTESLS